MLKVNEMRSYKDKVIVSTLPHISACYFAYIVNPWYAAIIVASTIASVAWHMAEEPKYHWLFYVDYGLTGAWFAADIMFAVQTKHIPVIIATLFVNLVTIITNIIEMSGISYEITHSIWHCISWIKGNIVAYIIAVNIR
jgi:hypothetical protein